MGIADDVLRDVYVRGKYRDVILPMTVIRIVSVMSSMRRWMESSMRWTRCVLRRRMGSGRWHRGRTDTALLALKAYGIIGAGRHRVKEA